MSENINKTKENDSDYSEYMGFKREVLEEGRAVYSCVVEKRHSNIMNMAHGGLLLGLADHAMGMAFAKTCDDYITIDIEYHFLKAAPLGGKVYAYAKIVRQGGKIMVAECKLTCQEELLGIATAQFYRFD